MGPDDKNMEPDDKDWSRMTKTTEADDKN